MECKIMSDIKYNRIDEDLQQKIISNRENHWMNPYANNNKYWIM